METRRDGMRESERGGNQNKRKDDYFGSDSCWRVKDIPSQTPWMLACTCVGSVAYPVCLCEPVPVLEVVCRRPQQRRL